ncbi:MAG: YbaK/EbsC family protein [Planctomycetota bacterium]|nr:YbaK/EbsC family protein [Planctomycetota bacterium]
MPLKKLKEALEQHHVHYETIRHDPAFTAQGIAATAHVSGNDMAKTVMVKLDDTMAMAVLPASRKVNFDRLKKAAGTSTAQLATEEEFASRFPNCEVGAMPPFGNVYDMEVFVDEPLTHDIDIAFNAGTHTELIQMRYDDYEAIVHPKVCEISG